MLIRWRGLIVNDKPGPAGQKEKRARHDQAVVEHGNERDRLGEQLHVAHLPRAHVGDEDANQSGRHQYQPDQMHKVQKKEPCLSG